jgi:hypothetical protein
MRQEQQHKIMNRHLECSYADDPIGKSNPCFGQLNESGLTCELCTLVTVENRKYNLQAVNGILFSFVDVR